MKVSGIAKTVRDTLRIEDPGEKETTEKRAFGHLLTLGAGQETENLDQVVCQSFQKLHGAEEKTIGVWSCRGVISQTEVKHGEVSQALSAF